MRSILWRFPKEKVRILKQNSEVLNDVEALVDSDTIFIDDATLAIEEGDIIERDLPSGIKEVYLVTDRGFYRGFQGIEDHYQVKVEKQSPYTKHCNAQVVNYNIGNAERININSTDNSTNIGSVTNYSVMDDLRTLAKGLDNEAEILSAVDQMQDNIGKRNFIEKYNNFIQCVANHMTIFAPLLPTLSSFLTNI